MSSSFPDDGVFNMDPAFPPQSSGLVNRQLACKRCNHAGVDVKLMDCGCYLHARCTPVAGNNTLNQCPFCHSPTRALFLMPMNFDELDAAKASAATMAPSSKRGKKRKNATIARLNPSANTTNPEESGDASDLRTGRWTTEETLYCDKLIEHFEDGSLPISEGIKLNDFLANMLKSKQSRLTKKMKNARLSAKTYKRTNGFIVSYEHAKSFSDLEKSFFDSIQCDLERAEIRFHMQKEWRELFSTYCVAMGQKLDADSWLSSVEEMDRRVSQAKDAARMARRKVMMGYALTQDSMNQERGVFIENPSSAEASSNEILSSHNTSGGQPTGHEQKKHRGGNSARALRMFSSPFVGKVIQYMHRHQVPFEHIDAWVPSFIPNGEQAVTQGGEQQKCRLCFAGFATTDTQMPADGGRPEALGTQEQFDLLSFGEYSSKFSFDVGSGLPGRVYNSGICSWEQGVANAPSHQFERCGGANQWGIKTVLGIPIPSPNVGRIVVLLYSRHDRTRDAEMVRRITEELTKLMPTPKWKLVVDVGDAPPKTESSGKPVDSRVSDVLRLLAEHVPTHRNSPYSPYLPGFTALRMLLVKQVKTPEEEDLMSTTLESYSSYLSSGRRDSEIAWMIARDFMLLSQSSSGSRQRQQQSQQQQQQQQQNQATNIQIQHQMQQAQAPVASVSRSTQQAIQQQFQQPHQHQQPTQQQVHHVSHNGITQTQMNQHLAPVGAQQVQHLPLSMGQVAPQQQQISRATNSIHGTNLAMNGMISHQHNKAAAAVHTLPGQILMNGASQPNTSMASHLAPAPGYTLQQTAFQPIVHQHHPPGSHPQHNGNVQAG